MPPELTSGNVCRNLPASVKLGLTLVTMITAGLIPPEHWPATMLLLVLTFVGLSLAEVEVAYLARRLGLFLPMLAMFGLTIPLGQLENPQAWSWMLTLWLRCIVAFLAGLWLIHVLPLPELLQALVRWHFPVLFVAMLAFMYRQIFILWDELARIRTARSARDFGQAGLWSRWVGNAQMIGLVLLRSMERAERTHAAMLARGWDGSMKFLGDDPRP